ncbi:MAG: GNAT family N-acetyltransferase [Turicibacter sp.]|nr:GNAT family N-acetyltransferase [Turicibacter sp.]
MIRKLNSADQEVLFSLLKRDPSKNLFIIGDIEIYGYETDFQELWGEFDGTGNLMAVLLRYYDSFIFYGLEGYHREGFVNIIQKHQPNVISGTLEILQPFEHDFQRYKVRDTYFAECTAASLSCLEGGLKEQVKVAVMEDALRLAAAVSQIEEFDSVKLESIESQASKLQKALQSKADRYYYIEEDGKIVSGIRTTAENSLSAMIVGVFTLPEYRKRGYTSVILGKMLTDLFQDKQSVCLFYDNPKAGNIYKRAGFQDIGMWRMMTRAD